jgi:hypothetical protein
MAAPPPDVIRTTADSVLARPYFKLDRPTSDDSEPLIFRIIEWILTPFKWLFDSLEGLPDFLRWIIVVVAAIVCALLIMHIVYSLLNALGEPRSRKKKLAVGAAAREAPPEQLEREAEGLAERGDLIGAVRVLFRAALRRLEVAEQKKFRPGFTNRELLRRYRSTAVFDSLQRFVETIDMKWYGEQPCLPEDYAACRTAHAWIRDHAPENRRAVRS